MLTPKNEPPSPGRLVAAEGITVNRFSKMNSLINVQISASACDMLAREFGINTELPTLMAIIYSAPPLRKSGDRPVDVP